MKIQSVVRRSLFSGSVPACGVSIGMAVVLCLVFGVSNQAHSADDVIDNISITTMKPPTRNPVLDSFDLYGLNRGLDEGGPLIDEVQNKDVPSLSDATKHCGTTSGNPVDYSTGNKIESELDFSDASNEMPLYLKRTYSPRSRGGIFGQFWSSTFDEYFVIDNYYSLSLGRPGGGYRNFFWFGGDKYYDSASPPQNPAAHVVDYIKKNADGTFTYFGSDFGSERYSAGGQILEIKNPQGIKWSFTYANGFLQRVTHTSGKYVQLNWVGAKLASTVDTAGNVYSYTYAWYSFAGDMLRTVALPGAPVTVVTYHYDHVGSVGSPLLTGKSFNGVRYSFFEYLNVLNANASLATATYHAGNVERYSFSYTYDEDGWITKSFKTNPLGLQSEHFFQNGKETATSVQQATYCGGGVSQRTYDPFGALSETIDFNGNVTKFSYSEFGQLQEKIEAFGTPLARRSVYQWDLNSGRMLRSTVIGLAQIDYTYDPKNRLASISVTNQSQYGVANQVRTTTYAYTEHANGMLASVTVDGPLVGAGDAVVSIFSSEGNLLTQQNSLGHTIQYSNYNGLGQPGRVVGANGEATDYVYDARGRVVKVRNYVNSTYADTDYAYNGEGLLSTVTAPDGVVTSYTYDAARRLLSTKRNVAGALASGAAFEELRYTYDAASNVTEVRTYADNILKASTLTDYDEQGRVRGRRGSNGQNVRYAYDSNGNLKSITDSSNRVTTMTYDALDRLLTSTDPLNEVTRFEYDLGDRTAKVTDPRNLSTTYIYDGFGQLWAQSSPDTGVTSFQYNAAGLRTMMTRNDGSSLGYSYDAQGRLAWMGTGTEARWYSYDWCTAGKSRLCGVSTADPQQELTSNIYAYTPHGQISAKGDTASPGGAQDWTGFSYDAMGRLTGISYPSGVSAGYAYGGGKLTTMTATINGTTQVVAGSIQYQPFGGIDNWTYGNGIARTYAYDMDGRVTNIRAERAANDLVQGLGFAYNANDEIAGISNAVDASVSQNYTYDALSRLTSQVLSWNTMALTYDGVGNRITRTDNGTLTSYAYPSDSHRLQSVVNANLSRTFNTNSVGNIDAWTGADGVQNSMAYDAYQRPASHARNGNITSYRFNALDQRVMKSQAGGGVSWRYVYMGQNTMLAERYANSSNNASQWTSYLWLAGQPVGLVKGSTLYWVSSDHLGRPEAVSNAAKQVVWRANNWAFNRGVALDQIGGYNLGFPGQYYDAESNLWHNGFRDYEPTIGRYLQSDPIGLAGGLNTYGYVSANPVSSTDSLGLAEYQGIDSIETHLRWLARIQNDDYDKDPHWMQNRLMIARLRLGRETDADAAFWHHETREAQKCDLVRQQQERGEISIAAALSHQLNAHRETLRVQGNTEQDLYHWSTAIVVFFSEGVWP